MVLIALDIIDFRLFYLDFVIRFIDCEDIGELLIFLNNLNISNNILLGLMTLYIFVLSISLVILLFKYTRVFLHNLNTKKDDFNLYLLQLISRHILNLVCIIIHVVYILNCSFFCFLIFLIGLFFCIVFILYIFSLLFFEKNKK